MEKKINDNYQEIFFKEMGDSRGSLIAIENNKQIPFDLKRIFYVYGSESDVIRGCHANRKTEFVLIAISGKCCVTIKDALTGKSHEIILDKPYKGLYLNKLVWKEMHSFSENAVLLVLCSEEYDSEEYVYDFKELEKEVNDVQSN